jgi:RimJ/RimL family protein N-acetyltransferase
MQPPRFLTDRLQLRPAEATDLDALWAIWRDPDVRRHLFDDREVTRELAGEALGRLIVHALDTLGLAELAGVCDVPNLASDRMLKRLGFVSQLECAGPRHRIRTYRLPLTSAEALG